MTYHEVLLQRHPTVDGGHAVAGLELVQVRLVQLVVHLVFDVALKTAIDACRATFQISVRH